MKTEPKLLQHLLDAGMPSLVRLNCWQDATVGRTWLLTVAHLSFVTQYNPTDLHPTILSCSARIARVPLGFLPMTLATARPNLSGFT